MSTLTVQIPDQVLERLQSVARVVHDDDAAGAGHRTASGERVEIHRDVFEADLAVLEFVFLTRAQNLGR